MIRFFCTLAIIGATTGALADDAPISLRINLEPSVSERLIAMGEWVTVSAFDFGQPARPDVPVDEIGQAYLGGEEVRLYPVSQTVHLQGLQEGTPRDWTKSLSVNVNVFTSRFTDEYNLIDCGIVDGTVITVQSTENVINCKWLGE